MTTETLDFESDVREIMREALEHAWEAGWIAGMGDFRPDGRIALNPYREMAR